jgi:hypothetical protein
MSEKMDQLFDAVMDGIEKALPHTDKLVDAAIIYALYERGKQAGNGLFPVIAYRLATSPEQDPGSITLGWGGISIPASSRFIGVLGLIASGLAVALDGLPMSSVGESTIPGFVTDGSDTTIIDEIIDENTTIETDDKGNERDIVDWAAVAHHVAEIAATPYIEQNMAVAAIAAASAAGIASGNIGGIPRAMAKASRDWWSLRLLEGEILKPWRT